MRCETRSTLLPPLEVLYRRLTELERERVELRGLLRLAQRREDYLQGDQAERPAGRRAEVTRP